jgi:serine/threonine protein phosphatase 1
MRWVIGDIHGMLRPLQALTALVQQQDPDARFFFLGDYVNRGPDSKAVVDFLIKLPNARFARGNHDDIFDYIINGECFERHPQLFTPVDCFRAFIQHGLDNTLLSYDIDYAAIEQVAYRPSPAALQKLIEPVPPEHRAWFRALPAVLEEPDFFVIHAKWDVTREDSSHQFTRTLQNRAALRHSVIWLRYDAGEITLKKAWHRLGIFGHTPVPNYPLLGRRNEYEPVVGEKMVLLDTAAALGPLGRLTAWCVEESRFVQVDRSGGPIR